MLFCEQDCVAYTMLKEERTCKSTIELLREIAGTVGNKDLTRGIDILETFDCNNVSTFYFFESDDYAETCTGLLSKQSSVDESPSISSNIALIASVTTSLCLMIPLCLTILVIICVCNKSKMKGYYQKWTHSSSYRSSNHGLENPVELTDIMQGMHEQTIGKTPALIKNETSMSITINRGDEEEEVVKLSAADIKKYEARFAQTVVKFSKLQLNECIGKGAFGKVF
jgi:hypothetical protein